MSDGPQGREGSKGLADHCGLLTRLKVDVGGPSGAPPGLFTYPSFFFPQDFSQGAPTVLLEEMFSEQAFH